MSAGRSLLFLLLVTLAAGRPGRAEGPALVDFEIQDQFGDVHRSADVAGTVVLLIGGDREGSQFTGDWGKAIRDALGDHPRYGEISQLAHADLRGVPFFLKGMIRGKFPQEPASWVLMDWKGVIAKAYDYTADSTNVLVFAPDGALAHHAAGREPEGATLEDLLGSLRRLLDG